MERAGPGSPDPCDRGTDGMGRPKTTLTRVLAVALLATVGVTLLHAPEARALSDPRDRMALHAALIDLMQRAAPGRTARWRNATTGNSGDIKVIKRANAGGQKCWDFQRTFTQGGQTQVVDGLACELEPGLWNIVSESAARPQRGGQTQPQQQARKPAYDRTMVRDTQQLLAGLGYDPGPADGAFGPQTKGALQVYQRDKGLPPDGKPSQTLVALLRQDTAARTTPQQVTPPQDDRPPQTVTPPQDETPPDDRQTPPGFGASDPDPDDSPQTADSMAGYCNEVVRQSTSSAGGAGISEVVPLQFCLINSEFANAAKADTSGAESVCALYDPERPSILEQAGAKDVASLQSYLQARYGDASVRADHAKNAETCVRHAHLQDDAEGAVYFALVMVGAGNAGYSELIADHYGLGFGLPGDLRRAADWMGAAATALKAGGQPVVNYQGIDRAPLLDLMVDELLAKAETGTPYSNRTLPGQDDSPRAPGDDQQDAPQTAPGGPSARAVEIARELLSYERDEITKTYSNFEYLLGAEAEQIEAGCLADKSDLVRRHEDGSAPLEQLVEAQTQDNAGKPDQNMLLTTAFCRAVSYRADDPTAMFYYDYVNYVLGKQVSAQNISYHYIVGNGVAQSRE